MKWVHRISLCLLALLIGSCDLVPTRSLVSTGSIAVDQPEIFDNAALQSQLDILRGQLAALGIVDTATLTGSLGAVQGTSLTQSSVSLQVLQRATPQVTTIVPSISAPAAQGTNDTQTTTGASLTPSVPTPPTPTASTDKLPAVASDAIGFINKQMELEAQLQGYQLLLGGSDFARYTRAGLSKDRIVIGFPISILPQPQHKNMAAEVQITYFPPNANQFPGTQICDPDSWEFGQALTQTESRYSKRDRDNAEAACSEQEQTPTVINILPRERSYNVVGVTSKASSAGVGAIIGTVSVGLAGGRSKETQYLVAQQDTTALQGQGSVICTPQLIEAAEKAGQEHCIENTRGIRFSWQFKPVLGEPYVRAGIRRTFVQLAIPNVRRPYPHYGGIVYVKTVWRPYDSDHGVVIEPADGVEKQQSGAVGGTGNESSPKVHTDEDIPVAVRNVYGHTFISSEVSDLDTFDQGNGVLQVSLRGEYLNGATVRIGGTVLGPTTAGFISDYNSLRFVASAQSLAQNGAYLISSEGVESHIGLDSICKLWDAHQECALHPDGTHRPRIQRIRISPVSETSSAVEIEVDRWLRLPLCKSGEDGNTTSDPGEQTAYESTYYHYKRDMRGDNDVDGDLEKRDLNLNIPAVVNRCRLSQFVNKLPLVAVVGGKTYGLSDAPFQSVSYVTSNANRKVTLLTVVASNDSLNTFPQVSLQTLFSQSEDDPEPQTFIPPGRVTITQDAQWMASHPPKTAPANPKRSRATPPKSPPAPAPAASAAGAKVPSHCESTGTCHYVVSGVNVDQFGLPDTPFKAPRNCPGQLVFDTVSEIQSNSRALTTPACARQITLLYASKTRDGSEFASEIVLPLNPTTPALSVAADTGIPKTGSGTPHFALYRPVSRASVFAGAATITVGIRNLKDQSATLTVNGADIVGAKDGSGNVLPVLAANQVVLSQDSSVSFQVRIFALDQSVNITAEGKNGGISAGVMTFPTPFVFSKDVSSATARTP